MRGVEIGSVMFGRTDPETGEASFADLELVRLAVPRRVYTNTHLAYVVEVLEQIRDRRDGLRHFTARFEELA